MWRRRRHIVRRLREEALAHPLLAASLAGSSVLAALLATGGDCSSFGRPTAMVEAAFVRSNDPQRRIRWAHDGSAEFGDRVGFLHRAITSRPDMVWSGAAAPARASIPTGGDGSTLDPR